MAHTCPDCGSYCTCEGDWDDIDFGDWEGCICCSVYLTSDARCAEDLQDDDDAEQGLHMDAAIAPPVEHVQNSDIIPAGEVDTQPRQ